MVREPHHEVQSVENCWPHPEERPKAASRRMSLPEDEAINSIYQRPASIAKQRNPELGTFSESSG
jgi:hypothetical protein